MICGACSFTWDVDDPEPPSCDPIREKRKHAVKKREDKKIQDSEWKGLKEALRTNNWSNVK